MEALVASGPTHDGANGCSIVKAMMECDSRFGRFEAEFIEGPIFQFGQVVHSFQCL